MSFRSLELRQMSAVAVGAVVGIAAALRGYGAWAIIGQQLAITVTSTTLLWAFSGWRPRLVCSVTSLRRLGGFSANVLGTRILFYLNRNLDNLLVGRFLGPAALGAYSISYNVMLAPFSQIAEPVQQVLMPAFSRLQDEPEHLGAIWLRVNKLIGAISVPALLGLVVVAPDFVHVVLGDKWRAATPVIQILSWVGLIQSLQRLNSTILLARDATHTLLRYSVIVLLASVVAFVVGLHWGIVGVAAGYAVSSTIVEPYYTWLTGRTVGVTLRSFLRSLAPVVGAAGAMAAGVAVARALLVSSGIGADARLAILVPLGAVLFVPLYLWREPETLDELRRLRPARGRASTVVAADVTAP
jgi:O-antigen/teichoic acid export membrane protein